MASIIRQKVGDKIYLYESVSYRNAEGKPRNHRVPIGKIDPATGQPIYKPEYLARIGSAEAVAESTASSPTFTVEAIQQSSVLEYGAMYLLQRIAEQIGLLAALQSALPTVWSAVLTLADYLVTAGDPFLYCEEWLSKTAAPDDIGSLSSQRISELLQTIPPDGREAFYRAWCQQRGEQEYLALDITSTSSYSDLIQDVEWGYNRDHEPLAQVNLCMLMGESSRLPIYQVLYSGSLKDVTTLETTLAKFGAIAGRQPVLVVMDKGFFSTRNVNAMLNRPTSMRFVMAVPFTSQFAKQMVASERKDIDRLDHTLVIGDDTLRAVTKERAWNPQHRLHTHVYFNAMKAAKLREDLYAHVTVLKDRAEADPPSALADDASQKYLRIRKSAGASSGYTVTVRNEIVAKELETAGWLVLISNDVRDAKRAIAIYRQKDVVEKGFLRLKADLDLGRLRVHSDDRMQNKVFIGFIALILLSHLHKGMLDQGLYQRMTMKKLLLVLAKLRVQRINGHRILFPLTKEQKTIYKAFAVQPPA